MYTDTHICTSINVAPERLKVSSQILNQIILSLCDSYFSANQLWRKSQ